MIRKILKTSLLLLALIVTVSYLLKPDKKLNKENIVEFKKKRAKFKKNHKSIAVKAKAYKESERSDKSDQNINEYFEALVLCNGFDKDDKYFLEMCTKIKESDGSKLNELMTSYESELSVIREYIKDFSYDMFNNFTFLLSIADTDEEAYLKFSKRFDMMYPLLAVTLLLDDINSSKEVYEIDPYTIVDQVEHLNDKIERKISSGFIPNFKK